MSEMTIRQFMDAARQYLLELMSSPQQNLATIPLRRDC